MKSPLGFLRATLGLSVLLTAGACATATFVPTRGAYPARPDDCDMEVFSSALPDREYVEMGIVEGEGNWWKADLADVLPKLKEEACRAGGDGIIIQSNTTFSEGRDGVRVQRISATVIRWTEGGGRN